MLVSVAAKRLRVAPLKGEGKEVARLASPQRCLSPKARRASLQSISNDSGATIFLYTFVQEACAAAATCKRLQRYVKESLAMPRVMIWTKECPAKPNQKFAALHRVCPRITEFEVVYHEDRAVAAMANGHSKLGTAGMMTGAVAFKCGKDFGRGHPFTTYTGHVQEVRFDASSLVQPTFSYLTTLDVTMKTQGFARMAPAFRRLKRLQHLSMSLEACFRMESYRNTTSIIETGVFESKELTTFVLHLFDIIIREKEAAMFSAFTKLESLEIASLAGIDDNEVPTFDKAKTLMVLCKSLNKGLKSLAINNLWREFRDKTWCELPFTLPRGLQTLIIPDVCSHRLNKDGRAFAIPFFRNLRQTHPKIQLALSSMVGHNARFSDEEAREYARWQPNITTTHTGRDWRKIDPTQLLYLSSYAKGSFEALKTANLEINDCRCLRALADALQLCSALECLTLESRCKYCSQVTSLVGNCPDWSTHSDFVDDLTLSNLHKLTTLSLEGGVVAAVAIPSLKDLPQLTALKIRDWPHEGVASTLRDALENATKLTWLHIEGCRHTPESEHALLRVAHTCPLKYLGWKLPPARTAIEERQSLDNVANFYKQLTAERPRVHFVFQSCANFFVDGNTFSNRWVYTTNDGAFTIRH